MHFNEEIQQPLNNCLQILTTPFVSPQPYNPLLHMSHIPLQIILFILLGYNDTPKNTKYVYTFVFLPLLYRDTYHYKLNM